MKIVVPYSKLSSKTAYCHDEPVSTSKFLSPPPPNTLFRAHIRTKYEYMRIRLSLLTCAVVNVIFAHRFRALTVCMRMKYKLGIESKYFTYFGHCKGSS